MVDIAFPTEVGECLQSDKCAWSYHFQQMCHSLAVTLLCCELCTSADLALPGCGFVAPYALAYLCCDHSRQSDGC